jgi:3-oxoacyl-[acyl-carrier-protein] synthase-3
MIRSIVKGFGSWVPERVVTNNELRFMDDQHIIRDEVQIETNDEWIQQRSGIRERRYVPADGDMRCSDIAKPAAEAAIADAGIEAKDIDCIIFATLSPDIHFPGSAVFLQTKLGITDGNCACYDIRQQCSGFLYGLEMADAFIKSGLYKNVLLVGSELHSHSLDYTTRGRNVTVLFGDGAGAFVLGPQDTDDDSAGVTYTKVYANGTGAYDLYLEIFDTAKRPYLYYDPKNRDENQAMYPQMKGKAVFLQAVRNMAIATKEALAATGLTWDDIDWFVPHQANLRINEKVAEVAEVPRDKVLNTIQFYGNTTAATVPLTIDHWRKEGKLKKGDRVLSAVFGSGYTWGAAIFRV